jgi:hypothetical protein
MKAGPRTSIFGEPALSGIIAGTSPNWLHMTFLAHLPCNEVSEAAGQKKSLADRNRTGA